MKKWVLLLSALAVLLLCLAAVRIYSIYERPERAFATPSPAPTRKIAATSAPTPTLSPEESLLRAADTDFMKDRVNLLLLGWDESPERNDASSDTYRGTKNGYRSDVMMLLAVNFAENSAHLISIPRDTYSPIYGVKGRWKINASFSKGGGKAGGGFECAMKTVEMLFGVPVPYYVGVNMEGLKHLVDALGGVDYDVDVEITLNGRTLEPGFQHLSGQQVLDYCRARKGISTDLGRADRQQRMLRAIFVELKDANRLTAIPAVYAACKDDVYTNLTAAQIAALASFAISLDPDTGLRRTTLAGEYVSNVYNASYYVLINKKLEALVQDEFGIEISRAERYDLAKVKRDKAAAQAAKEAAEAEDVTSMLVLPALAGDAQSLSGLGTDDDRLPESVEALNASIRAIRFALEVNTSETELTRLRRRLHGCVQAVAAEFGLDKGAFPSFPTLILP